MNITEPVDAIETRTRSFPHLPNPIRGWAWIDEFVRGTMNPTDVMVLYTSSVTNAGSVSIAANTRLELTTDAGIGDLATVFSSGLTMRLTSQNPSIDGRTKIVMEVTFKATSIDDVEGFVGFVFDTSALTGIPTTSKHVGLWYDRSTETNFILSSGNGSAQVKFDTGVTVDNAIRKIKFTWTGLNDVLVELFADVEDTEPESSTTVTAMGTDKLLLHLFVEAEAASSRVLTFYEWVVRWS